MIKPAMCLAELFAHEHKHEDKLFPTCNMNMTYCTLEFYMKYPTGWLKMKILVLVL